MALKHILVHLDTTRHCEKRVRIAVDLAQRFTAHLSAVFAEADPNAPDDLSTASRRASPGAEARTAMEAAEEVARGAGVEIETRFIPAVSYSQLTKHLGWAARDSDLAVLGQHDPAEGRGALPEDLVETVIRHCGRPVLVIPYAGNFPSLGTRVLVGWDGSREAARALNDAIPLMGGAESVRLQSVNPSPEVAAEAERLNENVLRHLEIHGIPAKVAQEPNPDVKTANVLLSRAADMAADLLVVGGLGEHRRRRESVARGLLDQLTVPALISH